MPNENLIPIQFSIVETSDPSITIDGDNSVEIYIGESIEFDATFERGGPPISEAQLRNSELQLFTDTDRTDRLGADDENAYTHEFREINMAEGTAKVNITVNSGVAARTLYAYLLVEQGT
ncbi:MAG: hypothetical protein F4036_00025 [Gammaproteobacteria bacterium]|nr:hypothetical protein [Gammaproteobacteria bacterium]